MCSCFGQSAEVRLCSCVRVLCGQCSVDSVGYRLCLCSCEQCMLNYVCVLVNSIGYVVFVLL